jgi:hypothetical protein
VTLGLFRRVRLYLMAAVEAPNDEPHAGRRSVPERHWVVGFRISSIYGLMRPTLIFGAP